MTQNKIYYAALIILALLTFTVSAYEQDTHRRLSITTVENSSLASPTNTILSDLGLSTDIGLLSSTQQFPNSKGKQRSIIRLIEDGSDYEDDFPRFIHHFYDPDNDQSLQKPFIIAFTHPSPDWALEDTGDINGQDDSYKNAMDAFYKALTLSTKDRT